MKIIKKLIFAMVILLFCMPLFYLITNASTNLRIDSNFNLYINGQLTTIHDVTMIYDTIYVPLRAVSEILAPDQQIQWDDDTRTVIIGERPSNLTPSRFTCCPEQVVFNGEVVRWEDCVFIRDGTLYVALINISAIFDVPTAWQPLTSSIIIGTRPERFIVYAMGDFGLIHSAFTISMDDFMQWQLQEFYAHPRGVERSFTGIPLKTIFENLGILVEDATGVRFHADDGFSVMLPWDEAIDSQNTFIAIKENGELFGTRQEGGSGPFRSVIALDPFANRWCRYLVRIDIVR